MLVWVRPVLPKAPQPTDKLVCAVSLDSIATVTRSLGTICASLGPSPLFDDQAALPALSETPSVTFQLRIQRCIASTTWTAVDFWRPMGFEPLTGAKDVTAFAVFEDGGAEVRASVEEWAKLMSAAYQVNPVLASFM